MTISPAVITDKPSVIRHDRHIPEAGLDECIRSGRVLVLKEKEAIVGVLRWSLFWQTIPFLDLLYIDNAHQHQGHGRRMMAHWENTMAELGYSHVMLSTQADEDAKFFYEKLGYRQIGAFLPPDQEADELMYLKEL